MTFSLGIPNIPPESSSDQMQVPRKLPGESRTGLHRDRARQGQVIRNLKTRTGCSIWLMSWTLSPSANAARLTSLSLPMERFLLARQQVLSLGPGRR